MRRILGADKVAPQAQQAIKNFHPEIVQEIEQSLQKNDWVIVGMSQNPVVKKARRFLDGKNIAYKYIEYGSYFSKWHQRLSIKLWSGWPTFPQVFHKGQLVGGCAELEKYTHF